MNNNLYNWHDERLAQLKRQDLDRELQQLDLLREAGLADGDRLVHLGRRIYGGMLSVGNWLKSHTALRHASFKPAGKKIMGG